MILSLTFSLGAFDMCFFLVNLICVFFFGLKFDVFEYNIVLHNYTELGFAPIKSTQSYSVFFWSKKLFCFFFVNKSYSASSSLFFVE